VRAGFSRRAGHYDRQARLQQAVAWRLARWCRDLPLPAGPVADLGAGSGLLSRALLRHWSALADQPPMQLDHCPSLLALNPLLLSATPLPQRLWDLNDGLPHELAQAALLASRPGGGGGGRALHRPGPARCRRRARRQRRPGPASPAPGPAALQPGNT